MTYRIEKNVPLTKRVGRRIYPFGEMQPGDSFPIEISSLSPEEVSDLVRKVGAAAQTYGRRHDMHFTVRLVREEQIIRVWRDPA